MDLFTVQYAQHQRNALLHETARAGAVGIHLAHTRRARRNRRWINAAILELARVPLVNCPIDERTAGGAGEPDLRHSTDANAY
jgi:hypothetical protein